MRGNAFTPSCSRSGPSSSASSGGSERAALAVFAALNTLSGCWLLQARLAFYAAVFAALAERREQLAADAAALEALANEGGRDAG